jgi:excisionase family DNA binding protein
MSPDTAYAYSFAEVGKRLGVSDDTVRRMVAAGDLPCVAVWGKRRITHRALQAYLDRLDAGVLPGVRRSNTAYRQAGANRPWALPARQ